MQKTRCWMAGSIFKKLRGLLAKFWAKLQLFLKRDGLRVDIKKDGGFFNKKTRPKRYLQIGTVRSRSDGSGRLGSRSNLGRWAQIGWFRALGLTGGGGARRSGSFRSGAAWGSPELGLSGVPVVVLSRIWPWNDHRDMRDPPRASTELGDGRSGVCGTGGSSTRRHSPA